MTLLAQDRDPKFRARFAQARRAEVVYGRALRKVGGYIGELVNALYDDEDAESVSVIERALRNYAIVLGDWSQIVAEKMLYDVASRDWQAWKETSADLGAGIAREVAYTPIGARMQALQAEQVRLIKSLPLEAAERVHDLARKALSDGTRAKDLAGEILRTGHVTKSRATLIARTEVGRASTTFTQARAEYIGSDGYTWLTARDFAVRPSHRAMDGKFVRWDSPPTLDGLTGHAGATPNCRCACLPSIPTQYLAMDGARRGRFMVAKMKAAPAQCSFS